MAPNLPSLEDHLKRLLRKQGACQTSASSATLNMHMNRINASTFALNLLEEFWPFDD